MDNRTPQEDERITLAQQADALLDQIHATTDQEQRHRLILRLADQILTSEEQQIADVLGEIEARYTMRHK